MPTFRFVDPADVDAETLVVPTRAGAPLTDGLPADAVAMAHPPPSKAASRITPSCTSR